MRKTCSLLPQQKPIALKQNAESPAAAEELLHGQLYKITLEPGSSQASVFVDMWPLFRPSNSCRRERGSARVSFCYTRHLSGRFTPHLFIPVWKSKRTIRVPHLYSVFLTLTLIHSSWVYCSMILINV